ncbi:unnamed protein product [Penicillium manginii]
MTDATPNQTQEMEDICAIFVHAGAGFHSYENEGKHLLACKHAVRAGMVFLRNGATAVDAVEMAITSLEDAPITNCGYGSNLNAEGVVEADASIVDHFGRSGAVGAVPNIKNPIMAARKIYDQSYTLPGMSRVPPNLLVGDGASHFAWNNGVVIVPHEALITPSTKERWKTWKQEISDWELKYPESNSKGDEKNPCIRRAGDHLKTHIARTFEDLNGQTKVHTELSSMHKAVETSDVEMVDMSSSSTASPRPRNGKSHQHTSEAVLPNKEPQNGDDPKPHSAKGSSLFGNSLGGDSITDTVGAIAVDRYGNIAAGSSSGGIGMKHHGRVGPAALIGIGTHVIPVDPADPDQTCVASVTSGTGEHIASTLAASTSADRVYFCQKSVGNGLSEQVTEQEALEAMITNEFSGHPALQNNDVKGSIGVMTVKKTKDSIELCFSHNTDSFVGFYCIHDERPADIGLIAGLGFYVK